MPTLSNEWPAASISGAAGSSISSLIASTGGTNIPFSSGGGTEAILRVVRGKNVVSAEDIDNGSNYYQPTLTNPIVSGDLGIFGAVNVDTANGEWSIQLGSGLAFNILIDIGNGVIEATLQNLSGFSQQEVAPEGWFVFAVYFTVIGTSATLQIWVNGVSQNGIASGTLSLGTIGSVNFVMSGDGGSNICQHQDIRTYGTLSIPSDIETITNQMVANLPPSTSGSKPIIVGQVPILLPGVF